MSLFLRTFLTTFLLSQMPYTDSSTDMNVYFCHTSLLFMIKHFMHMFLSLGFKGKNCHVYAKIPNL